MMGMGEPFHNYENVLAAIRAINSPDAFGRSAADRDLDRQLDPGDRQARRATAGQAGASLRPKTSCAALIPVTSVTPSQR
jgi:hypothetical protein